MTWYADRADELERQRVLASHMTEIAAMAPILRNQAEQLKGNSPATATLNSASDALAGATLQGLVQDCAARAGVRLNSTEILPPLQRGEWRRIGLRVSVVASLQGLTALLQMIQQGSVTMLVDDLQLHAIQARANSEGPMIDAAMTVYGFRGAPVPAQTQ
jgi:hypothetical protein